MYGWDGESEREIYRDIEGMNAILPFFSKTKWYNNIRIKKIIFDLNNICLSRYSLLF